MFNSEKIEGLETDIHNLRRDLYALNDKVNTRFEALEKMMVTNQGTELRPCPKCKHDTLQIKRIVTEQIGVVLGLFECSRNVYYCTVCGKSWIVKSETVQEEYIPKENK